MPRGVYTRKKKEPLFTSAQTSDGEIIEADYQPIAIPPLKVVDFDKLVGLKASLYYENHSNQFQLGSVLFEVIEDENDGYRSSMQEVQVVDTNHPRKDGDYLGPVVIEKFYTGDYDGYIIRDENDGHQWLLFGTSNHDDYYPCFSFNFTPKPTYTPKDQLDDLITKIN